MKKLYLLFLFCLSLVCGFSQSTSSIRSDGTILVNGQPFFPFGAYSIPFAQSEASKTQALNDMIAAGFNIATVEDDGTPATQAIVNNLLTIADNNNFKMLIGATHSPNIIYPPQKYKTHPSTFGYTLADDGDNGAYTPAQLTQRNADVKSYDNTHLTFLTLTGFTAANRNQANAFTAIADASGYQIYPIGFHRNSDFTVGTELTQTYLRTLGYVQSAALVNRPMIMHLQTFNWGSTKSNNPRYPTVSELRNMLYSGLAAGIKGVISYDFSFDLKNNQPDLWNEFKALRGDVQTLEAALMNGTLTRYNTGDQELVASYWTDATGCYVTVVNTSYTSSKTISLTTPPGYGGPITSLFSRMPATLSLSGNTLSGSLLPQAVQVYRLPAVAADRTDPVGSGTITARGENGGEGKAQAFDNDSSTKWLDFSGTSWIQFQFGSGAKFAVTKYTITSANDAEERDPRDWKLYGTNVANPTSLSQFTEVGAQSGVNFTSRFQKLDFTPTSSSTEYSTYRLEITANKNAGTSSAVSIIQLSEIELFAFPSSSPPPVTGVTVTPATASIAVGATQTLSAGVNPYNANQSVTWSSNNTNVANVNSNGIVTGVAAGMATITATSVADNTKSQTATITVNAVPIQTTLISFGSSWSYLDNGTNQGTVWRGTNYNANGWASGNAELGYGDGDEATVVSFGPDANAKYITTYFRKTINVSDVNAFTDFILNIKRDDGMVVYINGTEVWRNNMPTGTIAYNTLASTAAQDDGGVAQTLALSRATSMLVTGTNAIAVEMHQNVANSSDISFDFELKGQSPSSPPSGTGTGYYWRELATSSSDGTSATKIQSSAVNDGSLASNTIQDNNNDGFRQAVGIIWPSARTGINSVKFYNGTVTYDGGAFSPGEAVRVQYQTSAGGAWTDAPNWTISPAYAYSSAQASNQLYTFSGAAIASCIGIRVIGQVRTDNISWAIYYEELEAFINSSIVMRARSDEPAAEQKVGIYPNPANREVTISLAGFEGEAAVQVKLTDINGKPLLRRQVQIRAGVNQVTLPVSHLPQGLFFVTVQGSKTGKTTKLVITR